MLLGAGGVPDEPPGQQIFEFTGSRSTSDGVTSTATWTAGAGVTSISIVCVGGGGGGSRYNGGGGAALSYRNNVTVTPGTTSVSYTHLTLPTIYSV